MRCGYGKMGRSVLLDPDKWGAVGGDNEPPMVLRELAERNPDVEFWVTGRNSGENPQDLDYPSNVRNPWTELGWQEDLDALTEDTRDARHEFMDRFDDLSRELYESLDHIFVWAGQHGTSNLPIPKIKDRSETTRPQMSFVNYAGTLIHGINVWRDMSDGQQEETWLNPDPRNYPKARDLKWPITKTVISQFNEKRNNKVERYGDPRSPEELGFDTSRIEEQNGVWKVTYEHEYHRLEIVGIPDDIEPDLDWEGRSHFGIVINEARKNVTRDRLTAMLKYVMPLEPAFIHGKWSDDSMEKLGREIEPVHHSELWPIMKRTRTTFTTPSSGSQWATTKPWEAFANGVVCFFHPWYDTQGHIVPTLKQVEAKDKSQWTDLDYLGRYLRVPDAEQLKKRVEHLNTNAGRKDWEWIVDTQLALFDKAMVEKQAITEMEKRMRA